MEIVQNGKIRKFQNSGEIEPSFWDKLDNWAATAEIPMAVGATAATLATASSGGAAAPALVLNLGSAGIDAYQALRNLYKGNYAQAGLDGVELLAGLIGAKYAKAAKAVPSKAVRIQQAANKGSNSLEREYLRQKSKVRLRRASSKGMSVKEAAALRGAAFGTYGIVSAGTRNLIDAAPVDNTRVAQHRIYRKGGTAPDPTKGRFTFKKSQMVKDAEQLNGKKDMRKKLIKSDVVTNKKKRVSKGQEGLKFATYTPIETPLYKPDEISNPFSEYNFPTQYKEVYIERPQEQETAVVVESVKQEAPKQEETPAPKVTTQFGSRKDFVNTLYSHLYKALQDSGIDAKVWAPILTAHTSIESAWGNEFSRKNNNFGGIKGKGSGKVKTKEWSPERGYYTINDSFKSYASIDDFANDYVRMLKNRFKAFDGTPDQYLSNIRKHRYFTARLEDYQKMFNSRLRTVNSLLSS